MCLTIYLLLCTATWTHSDGYTFRKLIKAQPYPILTLSPPPKHLDFEEDRLNLGVPRQVLNASRMWACGGGGEGGILHHTGTRAVGDIHATREQVKCGGGNKDRSAACIINALLIIVLMCCGATWILLTFWCRISESIYQVLFFEYAI